MTALKPKILPFLLITVIDTIGAGIIIPILGPAIMSVHSPMLPAQISVSMRYFLYSAVLSAFFIFSFIASPFLGLLSDYYGRKRTLIICALVKSAGLFLTALSFVYGNIVLLILSRIIVGSSSATLAIAQASIANLSSDEKKAKNLGLATMATALGFLLGPILTGIFTNKNIYHGFEFSTPFFVAACLPLLTVIVLLFSKEIKVDLLETPGLPRMLRSIYQSLFDRKNSEVFISLVLRTVAWGYLYLSLSPYLTLVYNYNSVDNAIIIIYAVSLYMFASVALVPISIRYLKLFKSLVFFSVIIIAGTALLLCFNNEKIMWLAIGLIVLGFGASTPMIITMVSNLQANTQQGKIMGISGSLQSFSIAISSITIGFISAVMVTLPFAIIMALIIFSIIILRKQFITRIGK